MDPKTMAMQKVIADMGRAANKGRSTRFSRRKPAPVEVGGPLLEDAQPPGHAPDEMGDKTLPPTPVHDMAGMTPAELEELMSELQR